MNDTARLKKLTTLLQAADCPAIAFVPGPNFYYLTGVKLGLMERPTILIVTATGEMHAAIPALERDRWTAEVPQAQTIFWQDSDGYADALSRLAAQTGLSALAVEGNRMRHFEAAALAEAFGFAPTDGTTMLAPLRLHKDAEEIVKVERAVRISEQALEATLEVVKAGMSETEIRARLMIEMLERGADAPAFDLIVLAGGAAADCHGVPSADRRLKAGDALLFDFGAAVDGYSADITRTFFCEHVPDASRKLYETVQEANRIGREILQPGLSIHELDSAVQSHLADAGYADNIRHKVGHGLGLDVHEAPQLMVGNHQTLEEGMLITIEPGLYDPDVVGVRIEDDVLITADGARSLTTLPRDLRIVG
ncbi:M24 family metallopeptidase [Pelagovum pacificum]|uniref:Aminopeptidase P family protein n=1 Tax=Pelagovum pacificum TaxID=2588711 RepID=A0A5C5GHC7_9RHOB|nr:Xaa-Pro peptidase family protein [Pelagovum pacificum]QQA43572.1 aminopeptidase P family protein [Pelagovum pacificum]TNY33291.1 aminopeptidase P family protein [Pelagovum pacificum]